MRTINTEKMDRVAYNGHEIAFGKVQKNEYGEYVVKVYVDGAYDEDKTIYADSREDAEATKAEAIRDYSKREETLQECFDIMDDADQDVANAKLIQALREKTDDELYALGYLTYAALEDCKRNIEKVYAINSICCDIVKAREDARMIGQEARR